MRKTRRAVAIGWVGTLGALLLGLAAVALAASGTAAAAEGATSTKQKVLIRFWNWWDGPRKEWMDEVIRRFEAEYPWIDVRNEVQGWSDRSAKVLAAYAAGAPAELTMVLRQELAALSDMGAIIPITQFVQRDKLDLKEFFAAEVQAFIWDGELWSLPLPSVSGEGSMYFYNKRLFEEAGLDPEHPPVTWRAFQQAARKLTRINAQGRVTQLAIDTHPPMVVHMTYANGGQIISDDRRRALFDSQEAIEALRFVAIDLNQKALGGAAAIDAFRAGQTPAGPFVQGKQAMIGGHPSVIGVILDQAPKNFNWGVMPAPYNENNPKLQAARYCRFPMGMGLRHPEGIVAGEAGGGLALPQIHHHR
ncbi:MAG: extracellular solute-binding protein [Limnochordales bacterium]|nr:extracellular solute-binding protein [Limnochordales bacterium]